MVIENEGVTHEGFKDVLESSCHIEITVWCNYMSSLIWELKGILDLLAFIGVVQDFEGEQELSGRL